MLVTNCYICLDPLPFSMMYFLDGPDAGKTTGVSKILIAMTASYNWTVSTCELAGYHKSVFLGIVIISGQWLVTVLQWWCSAEPKQDKCQWMHFNRLSFVVPQLYVTHKKLIPIQQCCPTWTDWWRPATPRLRHSQDSPLPGAATSRGRHSQGEPLYSVSEHFINPTSVSANH